MLAVRKRKVVIRPFRKGDGAEFIGLVRQLARYEKLEPPAAPAARRLLRDIGKRVQVLLADIDGKPAGYAIYLFTYSSFLARPTLFLEDLFISPDLRRSGVGKEMFKALQGAARGEGGGRMEGIVLDWNRPALRFYDKLGAKRLRDWFFYRLALR